MFRVSFAFLRGVASGFGFDSASGFFLDFFFFSFFGFSGAGYREGDAQRTSLDGQGLVLPQHIRAEGAEHQQHRQHQNHQQQDADAL